MKDVLALVLAGGRVDELSVLTLPRPKSAVPFGGMYRVIDFPLSNLMHSGVERVGILSQYRSFSLINHVGVGAWWDFVGRDRGATMLLPSKGHQVSDWYKGTADAVYQNLEFVREQGAGTVLVLSGDHVYKMDYAPMLAYHREKDADVTVAFAPIEPQASSRFGVGELDDEDGETGGRVVRYLEKPRDAQLGLASLTIYLFKPQVLYRVLEANAGKESHEFGRDIIANMVGSHRVYGYRFTGYWGYSRTIDEYWQCNMNLLDEHPAIRLEEWQVRTNLDHDRLRDRPPARVGSAAQVENSLIHNGCLVDGEVSNSILFPGVRVEKGAVVRDSILFFDSVVRQGAVLKKVITDFEVEVGAGCVLGEGEDIPNRQTPELLSSGITLLGKGVHLPAGTCLGKNVIVHPGLTGERFAREQFESGLTIT
ncbi:MAG: glucose-1-phosphate adenylyltransferase [Calditrichaeota bacterium]|nr:MAG: glucose-1-phosphate adenylyltransferase [Calditrichota bacterium]